MFGSGKKTILMIVEGSLLGLVTSGLNELIRLCSYIHRSAHPVVGRLVRKAEEERLQDRQGMGVPGMENPCNSLL